MKVRGLETAAAYSEPPPLPKGKKSRALKLLRSRWRGGHHLTVQRNFDLPVQQRRCPGRMQVIEPHHHYNGLLQSSTFVSIRKETMDFNEKSSRSFVLSGHRVSYMSGSLP